ncbi:15929_t:CDS:2, partial [Cetraspora pellucida]
AVLLIHELKKPIRDKELLKQEVSMILLKPQQFPEIDILKELMQINSSDNDSVISIFFENYSFITKKYSKKLVGLGGRVSFLLPIEIADILFLYEEVVNKDFSEILSKEEDLSDQNIDFN